MTKSRGRGTPTSAPYARPRSVVSLEIVPAIMQAPTAENRHEQEQEKNVRVPDALSFLPVLLRRRRASHRGQESRGGGQGKTSGRDGLSLSEMPCPLSLGSHAAPAPSSRCQDSFPARVFAPGYRGAPRTTGGGGGEGWRRRGAPGQDNPAPLRATAGGLLIRPSLSNAIRDAKSPGLVTAPAVRREKISREQCPLSARAVLRLVSHSMHHPLNTRRFLQDRGPFFRSVRNNAVAEIVFSQKIRWLARVSLRQQRKLSQSRR